MSERPRTRMALLCRLLGHRWSKWQRRPFPNERVSFKRCVRCGEEKTL